MLKITLDPSGYFRIALDRNSTNFRQLYVLVNSLLTATPAGPEQWTLDYFDLVHLKSKLDSIGLKDGRIIDTSANQMYQHYQQIEKLNSDLKSGKYNYLIKDVLKDKLKTELYEDQFSGVSFVAANPRAGLFDTMGIGKTLEALATILALSDKVKKTLVVAPLSVLLDFKSQISKHTYLKSVTIPKGKKKALEFFNKLDMDDFDVLLVHPENLIEQGKFSVLAPLTIKLARMKFDMMILDEFHLYKDSSSKRSQAVSYLLSNIKDHNNSMVRAIFMTGTLVSETPSNAYLYLTSVGQQFLSFAKFEKCFNVYKKIPLKKFNPRTKKSYILEIDKIVGFKNLDALRRRVEFQSIRRTKEEMKGFPEKTFIVRNVPIEGKQKVLYRALMKNLMKDFSSRIDVDDFFKVDTRSIRLRQLLNHPKLIGEDAPSAKYDELDNILAEILSNDDQKVIIWTEYRTAVDLIHERWHDKYGVQKIYGGIDITDDLKHEFEYGKKIRIAACIPAKAGTGVDFLARARTAIYIDRPYSLTQDKQSQDRIHRRVKTTGELSELDKIRSQPATLIYLNVPNSIDDLVSEKLEMKSGMSKTVLASSIKKEDLKKYLA
jgi:hypothetical protein